MRILIHDFSGHPFQVHLSRSLAKKKYTVLHVYSKTFQTPKGSLQKKAYDPVNFNVVGISQRKPFPKYSFFQRWFAEKNYAKHLLKTISDFKPEIIISSNTPLDIQKLLHRQCKRRNIQFIFWVQDIYSIGIHQVLKKKLPVFGVLISQYYKRLEKFLLRNADHIVVISYDFKTIIQEWTNKKDITVIENWAPLDEMQPQPRKNKWSISHKIAHKFTFLYSGTLGMKHNPNILLQLSRHYRLNENTVIIVISEGIGAEWLKAEATKEKLNNILFFNYFDYELFPYVLSSADVLIAILDKSAGIYSVPSKVLSYHCIGRPLLLSVPKENLASRIVENNNSGFAKDSGDVNGFCKSADKLLKDKYLRLKMGENARKYAENAFDIDKKCDSFIRILG